MNWFSSTEQQQLLKTLERESEKLHFSERRHFLKNALMMAGSGALAMHGGAALAGNQNLPPNLPQWTGKLGDGVLTNPYGQPSKYEKDNIRRTVPWLTADAISSISMTPLHSLKGIITPNGLVFERYHAGVPTINPDEHRLIIHGLVDRP
ncbi:MAG: hypothetical protein MJK04_10855, partial [Psychrosphaera sp.]|nr:hypothetical protein [Psychrosphaera sp.]